MHIFFLGFLTIGLPTVKRPFNDHYYLKATLNSLISNIMEDIKEMITIVIFMADPDESWNNRTSNEFHTEFKLFIESGLIHIIIAPQNIYPNLNTIKRTKYDSVERVKWRSKQNVDFAFLMMYCEKLNKYYIQLEDDVLVAPDFINYIETFVSNQTNHWFCLEFSILGFIGKMFHSSDLFKMAATFLANYKLFPCDILLGWMRSTMGQKIPIHSPESLFQHIGKISSLKDKMMPSIDKKFKGFGSTALSIMTMQKGDNPPAKFETNMHMVNMTSFPPENVYKNNSYFVASNLKKIQYFKIIFEKYWNISRIVISTGDERTKKDILVSGVLKIGALNEKQPGKSCLDLRQIGKFIEGEFDSLIQGLHFPNINIKCLQIEVTRKQKQWLIIRDIAIFTK
jgi:alpha-1,3-mannosylglycoprotein beta-1,4-N-acetylglucosaminyltransferase C